MAVSTATNGTENGAICLISTLPEYVDQEKHKEILASTPADFSTLPSVLIYLAKDVTISFVPKLEGFSTDSSTKGSLYVIDSALAFMPSTGSQGFQIPYPAITLHAISRTETGPSIYCQLDDQYDPAKVNGTDEAEDDEAGEIRELTIVPSDSTLLEPIFEALSHCAALHPDPADADDMDDEDDADAFISTDADFDAQEMSEAGRVAMSYLESIIYNPFAKEELENAEEEDHVEDAEEGGHVEDADAVDNVTEQLSKATLDEKK